MRNKLFLTILTAILVSAFSAPITAAEIPLKEAISTLRAVEKSLKSARWESRVQPSIRVDDPDQVSIDNVEVFVSKDFPVFFQRAVLFDVVAKRFVVEEKSCAAPPEDPNDYNSLVSVVRAYSYDGKELSSWRRSKEGAKEPSEDDYTIGTISVDLDDAPEIAYFLNSNGANVGFGTGFPGYITGQNTDAVRSLSSMLSEWNKEGFTIAIQELSDGKWAIEAKIIHPMITYEEDPSGAPRMVERAIETERIIRIHLLPRSGLVVYLSRAAEIEGEEIEELRVEADVAIDEKQGAVLRKMYVMNPISRTMDYITFSSYEINPPVKKDMFSLVFPDGTYVDDYVEKKRYQAGDAVNKDQATSEFMTRQGLTGDVSARRDVFVIRLVLIGLGTAMILFALWRAVRRRKSAE